MEPAVHDLVFLPATAPDDRTYGTIPERIASYPGIAVHAIQFPTVVWYNAGVRDQAITQIRRLGLPSLILAGFSKSGLGAWGIARTIPEIVSGTIIFDAPVADENRYRWGADQFYSDDATWQRDLPLRSVEEFRAAMPEAHRLVLISGAEYHDEMSCLSQALSDAAFKHAFLSRPHLKHHWNSGWIEEGLGVQLEQPDGTRLR
jgi:pimeloyl-ACP methyl ester carboxylesterase